MNRRFIYYPCANGYLVIIDDFQSVWATAALAGTTAYPDLDSALAAFDTTQEWVLSPIEDPYGVGNTVIASRCTTLVWSGIPLGQNLVYFADFPEAIEWMLANQTI